MADTTRVLMIYPRFNPNSFWNYRSACELVGAKYPTAPLGLITLAALLPPHWEVRLVNRNTEELTEDDFAWADLVMTGGMMMQQPDTLRLIAMCRERGKPVAVGGPDVTSSPHVYAAADFRVLGEAEDIIGDFIAAWNAGERRGLFTAEPFKVDVTASPIPRFDLLKFDQYLFIGVQFSRGCPFTCEFCDIIELYGRVPRAKTNRQMLAELDALYQSGYRGHVDFVDDNLIGNKKAVKAFLPDLIAWQKERNYPFEFSTEASINLSDDSELLDLLKQANFFAIFVGIETPNAATLAATRKKQNTRRSLVESIHRIYAAGIFVTAGFIVGFDTEEGSVADEMVDFITEAAIPISIVGLLTALPNTQLTRRLAAEGRLHPDHDKVQEGLNDTCAQGLNFDTRRPLHEVLADYTLVMRRVFEPKAYCGRLLRLAHLLNRADRAVAPPQKKAAFDARGMAILRALIEKMPEQRELFWRTFTECAAVNPHATKHLMMILAFYLHLGPFARTTAAILEQRLAAMRPVSTSGTPAALVPA